MKSMTLLALGTVSLLIGGCASVCPAPGEPGFNNEKPCSYSLHVEKIYENRGEVMASVPSNVEGQKAEFKDVKYTFAVRDLKRLKDNNQIEEKKDYFFLSPHNGPILEMFPYNPKTK
jgi:hypothetical protein